MPINYKYSSNENTVWTTVRGALTMDDVDSYFHRLIADAAIQPGFIEIVDFNDIDSFPFSYKQAQPLRDLLGQMREKKANGVSLLFARNDFQFGMARMYGSMTEEVSDVRVFRTKEAVAQELLKLSE